MFYLCQHMHPNNNIITGLPVTSSDPTFYLPHLIGLFVATQRNHQSWPALLMPSYDVHHKKKTKQSFITSLTLKKKIQDIEEAADNEQRKKKIRDICKLKADSFIIVHSISWGPLTDVPLACCH